MKHYFPQLVIALALIPIGAMAQVNNVFDVESLMIDLLGKLGYLFWVAAIFFFFWGLVKFINNASDTAEHEQGKQFMVWGVISFFVLVSLWGIVSFILVDTLDINAAPLNYVDKNGATVL